MISLLLLFASKAGATQYYVDSAQVGYNNAGTPTGACLAANSGPGTISTPFCTMGKITAMDGASLLNPGDQVLFKTGDLWKEGLSIQNSHGAIGNPLIFGSYGTGARPILNGNGTIVDAFDLVNFGNNQSYITIQGFEITNYTEYGITWQSNNVAAAGGIAANNYIHNTGPGAYTGSTVGPDIFGYCVNHLAGSGSDCESNSFTGPTAVGPCDDCNYRNQLDAEVYNCSGTTASCASGIQFLNNIVNNCGGHNCVQVHHDTGSPQVIGNTVGPGCIHNCVDLKAVQGAVVDSNVSTTGANALPGVASFYTEDTFQDAETITFQRNLAYNSNALFQVENGGSCISPGTTCLKTVNIWNNTVYSWNTVPAPLGFPGNWSYAFIDSSGCAGATDTLNLRNNIWDGGNIDIDSIGSCVGLVFDYNDTGGAQGNNQTSVTPGTHDVQNIDPLYDSVLALNFHIKPLSPVRAIGLPSLVGTLTAMGAFAADSPANAALAPAYQALTLGAPGIPGTQITFNGFTSGKAVIQAPPVAGNPTIILPIVSGAMELSCTSIVVSSGGAGTFTNACILPTSVCRAFDYTANGTQPRLKTPATGSVSYTSVGATDSVGVACLN